MSALNVFDTIYHFCPDPVVVFTSQIVLYANPAAQLHLPDEDLDNHTPYAVVESLCPGHGLSFSRWKELMEKTNHTGSYSLEIKEEGSTTEWMLTLLKGVPGQKEEVYALQLKRRNTAAANNKKNFHRVDRLREELQEAKEQERFFHSMVEKAPDVIMRFDREFRYVYINDKVQELSGLPAAHYLGKRVDDPAIQMPQYILDIWRNSLQEVFTKGEKRRVEFQFPNGVWVDWHLAPELNEKGEVETVTAVARNIIDIKHLQELLQHSREDLESLAEAYPDVVMEFDRECRHLYCSENVIEEIGITADKFIGKTHKELGFPPEMCQFWEKQIKQVFTTKEMNRVEFRLPTGKYIDWYLVPNLTKNGKVKSVYSFSRDISHIKTIKKQLHLNEYKLSFALETSGVVFWEIDLETLTFRLTESLAKLYKVSFTPEKSGKLIRLKEDFIDRIVFEEDRKALWNLFHETERVGAEKALNNQSMVYRIEREGEFQYILINMRVIHDHEGKQICFGTSQDISELKRKENELEYYKERLEKLVEERTQALIKNKARLYEAMRIAKLGTWEIDFSKNTITVSDTVFRSLKLPMPESRFADMRLSQMMNYVHPADRPKVERLFDKVLKSGDIHKTYHEEYRIIDMEQNTIIVYTSVKLRKDERTKLYGIVQDISALRKAEAEIERLNTIVETTPDIVAIVSPKGQVQYLNEAGQQFFGLTLDDLCKPFYAWESEKGRNLHLLSQQAVNQANAHEVWQGETSLLDQDDHEVAFSQVVIAYFDEENNVECYSTIIRNISQQKQVEKDLLFKKNEMSTFVYRAYHDLKGPVTTMKGLYKIVQLDLKENKKALSYFTMYNQEAEKLQNTLLSLIDLTRITEEPIQKEPLSLKDLIEEGLRSFEKYPGFCDVRFSTNIDIPYPYQGDRKLIYTMLHYMIQNAIDFRDPEKDCSVKVEVYPSSAEDSLVLAVCDNGIGIEDVVKDKIFNMFYRGSEQSQGSGLGLYMVKVIADRLEAKVMVKSDPGKGTKISVFLPYLK